jgi:hypothetical protein
VLPTGKRETLLDVPAYDFNWQTSYVLEKPRLVPAGSVIHCRAVYDNSDANLANPDPTQSVRFGEQTWEEMMFGFFDVVMPREDKILAEKKPVHTGLDIVGLFDAADADRNGGLNETEASANALVKQHFAAIDRDHDQLLQLSEILEVARTWTGPRERRGNRSEQN